MRIESLASHADQALGRNLTCIQHIIDLHMWSRDTFTSHLNPVIEIEICFFTNRHRRDTR